MLKYSKAIAALVAAGSALAASYGFDMFENPETQAAFVSLVTAFVVWAVPNKPAN